MLKRPTGIHDAWLLEPRVFRDSRGYFLETWNREAFAVAGIKCDFVQDNHSRSRRHVLRGLHYQVGGEAQGKLVWVTRGKVFDVIVDLRQSSPNYGTWFGCYLTAARHECLWVPPGCAHGFLVLSGLADLHYKCTRRYSPEKERSVRWNDPTLAVQWPLLEATTPTLSPKDTSAPLFDACEKYS
jgi:dTDP-4-dehydrorhamnose 3,5-epimerase